jgi:hypothetical protein
MQLMDARTLSQLRDETLEALYGQNRSTIRSLARNPSKHATRLHRHVGFETALLAELDLRNARLTLF